MAPSPPRRVLRDVLTKAKNSGFRSRLATAKLGIDGGELHSP